MSAAKQYRMRELSDFLALSQEEFERFLPDLFAWFTVCKHLKEMGAECPELTWFDDGEPGIRGARIHVNGTGEVHTVGDVA